MVELIYTEIEIINAKAHEKAIWRGDILTPVASWTHHSPTEETGHAPILAPLAPKGRQQILQYDDYLLFHDDVTARDTTRSQQVIKWWRQECEIRGVVPRYAGFDCTAAGQVFGDLVDILWSKEVYKLNFSGKASDKPVSAFDPTPGHERYFNRVSEIWYHPKEGMRTGQIKGLCPEVIREICMRKKSDEKGETMRIKAESQD